MRNLVELQGKRILIIGGSSGIGRATAVQLSRLGAKLVLMARREEKLKEAIERLEGDGHAYYTVDVLNNDDLIKTLERACAECGPFDGMVYSAGTASYAPLELTSSELLNKVFQINTFAFIETVRQLTQTGRFRPGMRLVGVSSVASQKGKTSYVAHASAKAAMDSAVRALAAELSAKKICINTVQPGMTDTEIYQDYLSHYEEDSVELLLTTDRQFKGVCEPEDIAKAIAFLLSDAARMITGMCVPVDGGYLI